ncbi:MAG TPA: sigma-54 dependent transcriptional regulator [Candidatus Sulfotelmatobacter sp.]|nr:sigma-54 dependent transcriptional regulator [Candidatus Sulfotelmatobacter sp.]
MMQHSVLLVDDEPKMRDVLSTALEGFGYRSLPAANGEAALDLLEHEDIDLVLTDLRMPAMGGLDLLSAVKRRDPNLPVVLMTAYGSVKDAVQAMKEGAFDFVVKPFEIDELAAVLGNALKLHDALRDNQRLRAELEGRYSFTNLIGSSPAFRAVIAAIGEVCESKATVLVTGESGTGKEMVARAIHFNSSRKAGPFVAINCAAIPEGLLESELFGHVKGAFTGAVANRSGRFAQAHGGTLFLDEIGDMPIATQAKILRVLQERSFEPVGSTQTREVDVRLLAATNKDLQAEVRERRFREDLYYRLNVFPIALPPLRERIEDIPALAEHFVEQIGANIGKRLSGFTPAAIKAMSDYDWPGNIRELQNCIERSIIVAKNPLVDVADLPPYLFRQREERIEGGRIPSALDEELERIERRFIVAALQKTHGIQVKAAEMLGITERSLWHRIKKLGIQIIKQPAA